MRKFSNVPIDELEAGDVYSVIGMGPDSSEVTMETGRVRENGYTPFGAKRSLLGMNGYSGAAFRLE